MTQKVRKVLIMVVMAALILCLMAASLTYTFTYGRYAGNDFNADDSPYDDLIEFVGSREYTVRTPEELIQAIEDGYSNIQIAVDAEEPFVITEGVTDVSANLVLDLNGKVVVRNSRNPLLDVQTNVSVVLVYDSSKEGQGAFYNPVGSSLQASGGTLTVGSGNYEDGPRAEEYGNVSSAVTLGTQPADVTIYTRNGITDPSSVDRAVQTSYTKIEDPQNLVPATTGRYYQPETSNSAYTLVPADTFLIYTEEENCFIGDDTPLNGVTFVKDQLYVDAEREGDVISASEFISPECNVASCDFYYYYPIDENGSPINTPGTADTPQDYAVIYGYWDVMALAEKEDKSLTSGNDTNLIWPYAAVRMVNGEGFVRGGNFKNNFNAVNTYGIYATDGRLAVSQVPVTSGSITTNFTTGGDGVCIRVSSSAGSTTGGDEGGGTLDISGGSFSSEIGNTIEMQGGTMNVTAGTFTKNAAVEGADSGEGANNGSAIDITGGTLTMTGSDAKSFTITGSHVNGVRVEGADDTTATATIENATFNFNEGEGSNSVAGVRSFGGTLTVRYSTFNISNGATSGKTITRAAGLSTQGGTVTATTCIFNFAQENATVFPTASAGISSLGGTVTAENCEFTIPGNGNYGIYSQITVTGDDQDDQYDTTATNCTFTLTGNSNHGIYAAGGKTLASGGTITMIGSGSDRDDNFGIHSTNGITRATGCTITMTGEYVVGVYTTGGRALIEGGSINVGFAENKTDKFLTSTAVSTEGGEIYLAGKLAIESASLGVTVRGNANMSGSLEIASDTITTGDGTTYPDITPGNVAIKTQNATGIYVNNGNLTNKGTVTVTSFVGNEEGADNGWSWVDENGNAIDFNKYNGVYVQGGSLVSEGTLNVTFTGVENAEHNTETDNGNANTSYLNQRIKSYAVRVEGDDSTNVAIASGDINNQVGGGVYVGGGTVTLGKQGTNSGPTVVTTGTRVDTQVNLGSEETTTWRYWWSRTGGDAVKVVDGRLTIYGGEYRAAQGNGIFVNGGTASEGQTYAVQIYDGTFFGADGGSSAQITGPAASYAIKVADGSVLIEGGSFGVEENTTRNHGAALFMGTSNDNRGTIQVEGGTFEGRGADTIVIYRYANVTLEKPTVTNDGASAVSLTNDVGYDGEDSRGSSVTIEGGTYTGGNDAIWYGCSVDSLSITGGTFTGTNQYGMYFYVDPGSNVGIIGGTFTGTDRAFWAREPGDISSTDIFNLNGQNGWCYSDTALQNPITYRAIEWFTRYDYHVGGGYGVDLDGNLDYLGGTYNGSFDDHRKITISTQTSGSADY